MYYTDEVSAAIVREKLFNQLVMTPPTTRSWFNEHIYNSPKIIFFPNIVDVHIFFLIFPISQQLGFDHYGKKKEKKRASTIFGEK